ncbi:hypothetical protein WJ438_11195 [Streptomyces sp. GD-15H]|uniref:hypothetical protein n=1 Tax=Streptomyces sp. GD-15H TaxID=3129112 RepID=UPI00324D06E2
MEFDHVLVVEPSAIVDQEPAGLRLLYISLTRSTQSLTIMHSTPLPPALTGADDSRSPETEPRQDTEGGAMPRIGTDLRVRVISVSGGMYRAEPTEATTDRPLYVAVRSGAVPPAVGTELDVWVLRHSSNATFVTADEFGRLPISPTMLERYLDALGIIEDLTGGDVPDNARSRISELKGMATRCLKLDQHDWLDVWRVLGSPDKSSLSRLQNLAVSTNHALKSGTFDPDVFRTELAQSGWSDALSTAREALTRRLTAPVEGKHRTEDTSPLPQPQSVTDTPESHEQYEQPQQNASKESGTMAATPYTAEPTADLLQHLEAAVAGDRACKTHEAVRFELMAALLRADLQPENLTVTDVSCGTETGLALYEVLGAGQTSHADLRAGAARLLEAEHALPTKADRLYLVLSEPPAEPWSADSIRDVFTIDVIWRTPGGWEGNEAKTALGAG